ncbi:MAG TPA: transposase [Victivallales bacterium]|nr:transposase [Victivallales bacterium]|tara:strand:+ start:243 stop:1514 length:1272 start_codon:yes stop_codon:yes gene_type:complete
MIFNADASDNVYKKILRDHWVDFKKEYPWYDTSYYDELIYKLQNCRNPQKMGYAHYRCSHCGKGNRTVAMTCKSYLCLSCAKKKVDSWVCSVSKLLNPGMMYRHTVLTVPEVLRNLFWSFNDLLKKLPKYGADCLNALFSKIVRKKIKGGYIIVIQTHGRSGSYNVHLHIIATSGGFDEYDNFKEIKFFPYELLHKMWQKYLLKLLEDVLGGLSHLYIQCCKDDYPNGFVAYIDEKVVPVDFRGLARYLAKYVVAPPISVNRIDDYDGVKVTYHYKAHKTDRVEYETVPVLVFIERIIQHVMPKGINSIKHYGIQAGAVYMKYRQKFIDFCLKIGKVIKNFSKNIPGPSYRKCYQQSTGIDPLKCPYCDSEMILWEMWHPKLGIFYEGFTNALNDILLKKSKTESDFNPAGDILYHEKILCAE